jgi:hypothetical protein
MLVLIPILLSFTNAQIQEYNIIEIQDYVLKDTCYNIVTVCTNCTNVEIQNVRYNNTIYPINEVMNNSGYTYYYEFCNTSYMGEYVATVLRYYNPVQQEIDVRVFTVNQWGISATSFYYYIIFYVVLLFISLLFVYKYATFDGKGIKNGYMFLWASFFNLVIFVIMTIYPTVSNLLTDIIRMLFFGTGAYFLIEGITGVLAQSEQRN